MSKAAISVFVFGIYLVLNGVTLALAPNFMLASLRQPPTNDPFIRCLGVVVFVLGLYYIQAGRQEVMPFFRWTLWGRPIVLLSFIGLVAAGVAPPILIGFGVVDTLGAVWTFFALRSQVVPRA